MLVAGSDVSVVDVRDKVLLCYGFDRDKDIRQLQSQSFHWYAETRKIGDRHIKNARSFKFKHLSIRTNRRISLFPGQEKLLYKKVKLACDSTEFNNNIYSFKC